MVGYLLSIRHRSPATLPGRSTSLPRVQILVLSDRYGAHPGGIGANPFAQAVRRPASGRRVPIEA